MALKGKWGRKTQDAIEMMKNLDGPTRDRILKDMEDKDPEMALIIRQNLITFSDLKYLTTSMILNLLKEIPLSKWAMAFRACDQDVRDHFLSQLSDRLKKEVDEELAGPKQKLSEINKAQDEIMKIVRDKIDRGEIVLDREGFDKYI